MTEITAFRTKTGRNPVFYVAEVNPHAPQSNPASIMNANGSTPSPETTQPSIQPKKTFPWDYTVSGKQPKSVSELTAYTPRETDGITRNDDENPRKNNRPRKLRFSLDNPAFYEKSNRDYPINDEFGPPISQKDVEPGLQRKHYPSSPEERKDSAKKKSTRRYCILIIVVIILILLLLAMTGLFIWRMLCCNDKDDKVDSTPTPVPAAKPSGCKVNPNPFVFKTLPRSILKELDSFSAFLEAGVSKNQAAAVSVNIVYGDKVIWEKGLGVINKAEQPPRSPNSKTMYPCGSGSKVLTTVVLFKLLNDKRVESLDDNLVRYESNFRVKNPFNDLQITLRQLASQRSGLKREAPCYPIPEGSSNLCPYDYNTMLNRIKNLTLIRSPGLKPQYSNLGFALLGRVLWHKFASSGLTFDQWMKNEIFSKLNMMNTTFSPSNSQKLRMPVGYLDGTYVNQIYDWGWLQPAGGMFSTVDDWAKLVIELMSSKSNNRFLSKVLTEELFKPDYIFPDGKTITGTPWESQQHDGYIIREKSGYIYGYNSYVAMVPELQLGINMFCTDCQNKLGASIPSYFKKIVSVLKEELFRASTKNFTLPSDTKPFLGQYNSTIPTLKRIDIKEETRYLIFVVDGFDLFLMNSTGPLTLEISINPLFDCMIAYELGVEHEVIVFDKPSSRDGKSPGFYMYGASVDGRTYFSRVN